VRTDRGDFILDNLEGAINEWRDTPYTYLKRQSSDHAGRWVTIDDSRRHLAQK
ncbi:MAG: transglutaminase-like cysteine peptidase, partial [Pseudomonadota bacterium]